MLWQATPMSSLRPALDCLEVREASNADRARIYALRHAVYARELAQHPTNADQRLSDPLDESNRYIVAANGDDVVGFISITPPQAGHYSIDKYVRRDAVALHFDDGLFEIRLLTVMPEWRQTPLAWLLMLAGLRWVQHHGGRQIVAIGRVEVLGIYLKVGLQRLGHTIESGAVRFELLAASTMQIEKTCFPRYDTLKQRVFARVRWSLPVPLDWPVECEHGGASFRAIGERFDTLSRRHEIITADVLDAWFPPPPSVLDALTFDAAWTSRSSPPIKGDGLRLEIARARRIPPQCVVLGGGSSDLIYRALPRWIGPQSRAMVFEPGYGEYAHLLRHVIGCHVESVSLPDENAELVQLDAIRRARREQFDLVVLINPNNPTGSLVRPEPLQRALRETPGPTLIWIDEAYSEYAGPDLSMEPFAAAHDGVVVCKTMSKVYAMSGLRAAYMVTTPLRADELRRWTPPWCIGLPSQIAAVRALRETSYYEDRWRETGSLRERLADGVRMLGGDVTAGFINAVVWRLPARGLNAAQVVARCREFGLYLRDLSGLSAQYQSRAVRISVKDEATIDRMLAVLESI